MTIILFSLMSNDELKVRQVKWQDEAHNLRHIRATVFIKEQHVPEDMEWDEHDETCIHVLVTKQGEPIATGRLLETGQIGRMAVLKSHRNKGIGRRLLEKLLLIASKKNMKLVFLNAQLDAVSFYKKYDFEEEGRVFEDAGIPHIKMKKKLILKDICSKKEI